MVFGLTSARALFGLFTGRVRTERRASARAALAPDAPEVIDLLDDEDDAWCDAGATEGVLTTSRVVVPARAFDTPVGSKRRRVDTPTRAPARACARDDPDSDSDVSAIAFPVSRRGLGGRRSPAKPWRSRHDAEARGLRWLREVVLPLLRETMRRDDIILEKRPENFYADAFIGVRAGPAAFDPAPRALVELQIKTSETRYTQTDWGSEDWSFCGVNKIHRIHGPAVLLLMGLDRETALSGNHTERRAYRVCCLAKRDVPAGAASASFAVGHRSDRWHWSRYAVGNEPECDDVATPLAACLARHVDEALASSSPPFIPGAPRPRMASPTTTTERARATRRDARLAGLGEWRPAEDARAHDYVLTLGEDAGYGGALGCSARGFKVQDKSATGVKSANAYVNLTRSASARRARNVPGRFGAPYTEGDFDFLHVHLCGEHFARGFFLVPMHELVRRNHVLMEGRAGEPGRVFDETKPLDTFVALRLDGAKGQTRKDGSWATAYFVAYEGGEDDAPDDGAVREARNLLIAASWEPEE